MALNSIMSSKMRSFLTMLGIIIGISAVIILVSLMDGLTGQVTDMFADLGTTAIQAAIQARSVTRRVDPDDAYKFIEENSASIAAVSPSVPVAGTIKKDTTNDSGSASGVSESYKDIMNLKIEQGRFIQYTDVVNLGKVCVIGTYQEEHYFGKGEALGGKLKINGLPFTVIGVLEESEDSVSGSGDDIIYIPYSTAMKINKTNLVSSYTFAAVNEDTVDEAAARIRAFLLKEIGDDDYYTVISMKEMLEYMSTILGSMQTVLVAIAGISLLVGGIGIMNIMLVSVTERTREIGIRKSLGAKHKDIMMQFVIEAGTVSCIGGVIGIIFGALVAVAAGELLLDAAITPSLTSIIVAFSVSVAIGVGFGYLPAKKAAQLNPIDALRYD